MSEKAFGKAMEELLKLSPADREKKQPANGYEEVAKTIIEKAVGDRDSAMLKYVSDFIEKGAQPAATAAQDTKSKLDILAETALEGIDE